MRVWQASSGKTSGSSRARCAAGCGQGLVNTSPCWSFSAGLLAAYDAEVHNGDEQHDQEQGECDNQDALRIEQA